MAAKTHSWYADVAHELSENERMDQEQQTIFDFLLDYYKAVVHITRPEEAATYVICQLNDTKRTDRAAHQIVRVCSVANEWDSPWPQRVGEVLNILGERYGQKALKPSGTKAVSDEEDVSQDEEELWEAYMKGWERAGATTQRIAPGALETLDASQADGSLALEDLLDAYPYKGRSPHEK